ncbi:MarR family winged helix-turn-helix transcriptional regulator [Streptomyces sp. NPDC050560]|uniref:MarR family winged helix-turn-helix transcriptional regulator n=1 Tax=Streptomyces sp. NPDC050560 TaxID=3365630 RepID=UPI0037AC32F2
MSESPSADPAAPPSPGGRDSAAAARRLSLAITRLRSRLREETGQYETGLTLSQLGVIQSVVHEGPVTAARLARLQHVTQQSIAQHVAPLVAAGYLRKESDPEDGRKSLITVTDEGRTLFTSLVSSRESFLARAIDRLVPPEDTAALDRAIALLEEFARVDLRGAGGGDT